MRGSKAGKHNSGIKMIRVSNMSLLIFVVFARFLALTATFWLVNDHLIMQELTMNQSKLHIAEVGI